MKTCILSFLGIMGALSVSLASPSVAVADDKLETLLEQLSGTRGWLTRQYEVIPAPPCETISHCSSREPQNRETYPLYDLIDEINIDPQRDLSGYHADLFRFFHAFNQDDLSGNRMVLSNDLREENGMYPARAILSDCYIYSSSLARNASIRDLLSSYLLNAYANPSEDKPTRVCASLGLLAFLDDTLGKKVFDSDAGRDSDFLRIIAITGKQIFMKGAWNQYQDGFDGGASWFRRKALEPIFSRYGSLILVKLPSLLAATASSSPGAYLTLNSNLDFVFPKGSSPEILRKVFAAHFQVLNGAIGSKRVELILGSVHGIRLYASAIKGSLPAAFKDKLEKVIQIYKPASGDLEGQTYKAAKDLYSSLYL